MLRLSIKYVVGIAAILAVLGLSFVPLPISQSLETLAISDLDGIKTAYAADGSAQIQFVSKYAMVEIQVIGALEHGDVVNMTWNFEPDQNVTVFTTWGWFWRIQYFCSGIECWFGEYPDDPAPMVWVTYADGFTENKKCTNRTIGTLANVSSCYLSYPGPGSSGDDGGTGGDDGGGTGGDDGGEPAPSPDPLPPQITNVVVPVEVSMGQRPGIEMYIYNPNAMEMLVADVRVRISTDIPSRFDPVASSVFFEDEVVAPTSTERYLGAPNVMYYRWIDMSWPAFAMCDYGEDEFIAGIREALLWAGAGEAAQVSDQLVNLGNGVKTMQTQEAVWKVETIYGVISGARDLYQVNVGEAADYILPAGEFVLTPSIGDGIQDSPRVVRVVVPQTYQSNLANGMNALSFTVTTMTTADLLASFADVPGSKVALPWWVGPAIAYTDGIAMMWSCYPVSVAYSTPIDGPIIYANGDAASSNHVAAPLGFSLPTPVESELNQYDVQYRVVLSALDQLSQVLEQSAILLGDTPSPGQMNQAQQEILPAIDLVLREVSTLREMLDINSSDSYTELLDTSNLEGLLTTMRTAVESGDPQFIQCLAVQSPNPPITGSGDIQGTNGNDIIIGSNKADVISGNGGDDCIIGGEGKDVLYGGDGQDILFGDNGIDNLYGGEGNDYLSDGNGSDRIDGGNGYDVFLIGNGPDQISGVEYQFDPK